MKKITPISRHLINAATKHNVWDLGNKTLYDLCRKYPAHETDQEIIAKIWLVGRSYAAAIERRKTVDHANDDFYADVVVPSIKRSRMDKWISALPKRTASCDCHVVSAIEVHRKVTDLFQSFTGLNKRSLASKYLHFHRPDLFFIFDSRADIGIRALTPHFRQIDSVPFDPESMDKEYHHFCSRMCWLRKQIKQCYGKSLSPRELDKLLLIIHSRKN